MSSLPQIDSFDDVQCEEVWEVCESDDSFIGFPEPPEQHPCLVDEFGYSNNFRMADITFMCEYLSIRNLWRTPGYYSTLRDLLMSGF